jgi:hypothetical protein
VTARITSVVQTVRLKSVSGPPNLVNKGQLNGPYVGVLLSMA